MAKKKSRLSLFTEITGMTSRMKKITPKLARTMLETMEYSRQRPLKLVTIGFLGLLMDDGAFRPGSQISIAVVGKKRYIIDGRHRLTVVATHGIAQMFSIVEYRCKTMAQVHELYVSFDSGVGARSKSDMFVAYYGPNSLKGIGKIRTASLISAVGQIVNDFTETHRRIQAHYAALYCKCAHIFLGEMQEYITTLEGQTGPLLRKRLYRKSVLSVALLTFKHQPTKAKKFWDVVAHGGSDRRCDPAQTLREFLISDEPFRGHGVYTHRAMAHIVAWCWNAYFKNCRIRCIDIDAAVTGMPIHIEGTPFMYSRDDAMFIHATRDYFIGGERREAVKKNAQCAKTRGTPDYNENSDRKGGQAKPRNRRKRAG